MIYKYLSIRYNSKHAIKTETKKLIDFIKNISELKQSDKAQFENEINNPWGVISLIKCNKSGNYSLEKGEYFEKVNLIEILFSDTNESFNHYFKIGAKISKELNWEMVDVDTEKIILNKK